MRRLLVVALLGGCGSGGGGLVVGGPPADALAPAEVGVMADVGAVAVGPDLGLSVDAAVPVDAPADAAVDGLTVATLDAGVDAAISVDGATSFPARLYDGVWLVGWSGGLEHVSWVRFVPGGQGLAGLFGRWLVAPVSCGACAPYIGGPTPSGCTSLHGTFSVGLPNAIVLQLPGACAIDGGEPPTITWRFSDFRPTVRRGAIEEVSIATTPASPGGIFGEKFPSDFCSEDLSACQNPFGF
jgi:hypothetical protein